MPKVMKREICEIALELLEDGEEGAGVCIACGEVTYGVEPDAEEYECDSCGKNKVYGAEQVLIMFAI